MQCPHCSFVGGTSVRSLRVHIQKMHSTSTERHADSAHVSNLLQLIDAQVDESPFNTDIPEASVKKYLIFQRTFVEKMKQQSIDHCMSKVKTKEGLFATGKKRAYMLVLLYVSKRPHLSEADATALLDLIKELSAIDGIEIPLPSR
jgi:hypothetical protein